MQSLLIEAKTRTGNSSLPNEYPPNTGNNPLVFVGTPYTQVIHRE